MQEIIATQISSHRVVKMSWNEAYPASSGIKCLTCGICSLGWLGSPPEEISGKCIPRTSAPSTNQPRKEVV